MITDTNMRDSGTDYPVRLCVPYLLPGPFKKLKRFSHQLNSKPNGSVSLFTTVFRHSVKSLPAVCCNGWQRWTWIKS